MSTITAPGGAPEQAKTDPFYYGWRYVWQTDENGKKVQVEVPLTLEDVLHPQEEDHIMITPAHDRDCHYLEGVLLVTLAGVPDAQVLHDVRTDWGVEGLRPMGPDLSVFLNVPRQWDITKGTFRVRELGARPVLVIEVTSENTRNVDLDEKVLKYYQGGVPFYAIVDYCPEMEERKVKILGYRATAEGYVRLPLNEKGWLWLEPVGLWLAGEGDRAVCYDREGNRIPDIVQLAETVKQADARVEEAQLQTEEAVQARQEADRRATEADRKAEEADRRATEADRKAAEAARAKQEAENRATDLATRLQQMEAELNRIRGQA
jgi:hypothetical protein